MADLKFKPVPHDHPEFIKRAKLRPGFSEAYAGLKVEYALVSQMLAARSKAALTQRDAVKSAKED